ncbi:hypothetical protein P3T27_007918 [Kitasatospora sp. MAA19]|nr:transposase [Kitasatospora sp. MAA19]MDH6711166.1 hypothetical protein [Kitasatospora sp. MAA19]
MGTERCTAAYTTAGSTSVGCGPGATRLARVLRDFPVELVGRIRSDCVMRLQKLPRMHGANGRAPKHGPEFRFTEPETRPEPAITTATDTAPLR